MHVLETHALVRNLKDLPQRPEDIGASDRGASGAEEVRSRYQGGGTRLQYNM
jgi:hypothetical protein